MLHMGRTISPGLKVADELLAELGPIIAGERAALATGCHERAISILHLHAMTVLDARGPLSMGQLAEHLGSSLPTLTGLVSRLEERGLVDRTHDRDDRRVVLVALTPAGTVQLHELTAVRRQRLGAALAHLTEDEQHSLVSSIRILHAAFDRARSHGATA